MYNYHKWIHCCCCCNWQSNPNTAESYAAFRLACHSPLCHFDGDICTIAQTSLAAQRWPSSKQHLANKSMTLPLCPHWQIACSWLQFNSGATLLCHEPLGQHNSVLTMKLQAAFFCRAKRQSIKWQAIMKAVLWVPNILK